MTNLASKAFYLYLVLALFYGCGPDKPADIEQAEAQLPDKIDFNFHVKPILSDRCFKCHGPDNKARKANLRFDVKESAFGELSEDKGHFAVRPGKLSKSELYYRIISNDPDTQMPPPESNLTLNTEEKAILVKWIEQGAEWKPHWSLIKPEKPAVPAIEDKKVCQNPIDNFVRAKLKEKNLQPSPEASKETLIRRLSFDLTGLPPTINEIDDFLRDQSPDAYEKVVDRLLKSPTYGERMAAEWLDVARYADSHGYQDDGMRNIWPWRDWVIKAFNENMPYNQFVTWQLAGDLLPNPTKEQILATAFNRNHMQSQEGGIVPEEYRTEYVIDRTNTLGTAFLGLTLQCARCHDHKYDPITQKEYYSLFAFFNSVHEHGQIPYMGEPSPTLTLTNPKSDSAITAIHQLISKYETETSPDKNIYKTGFETWKSKVKQGKVELPTQLNGLIGYFPLDKELKDDGVLNQVTGKVQGKISGRDEAKPQLVEGEKDKGRKLVGDGFINLGDKFAYFERNEPFSVGLWVNLQKDSLSGPIFSRSGGYFNGNRGYDLMLNEDGTISATLNHVWPANSIEVHTKEKLPVSQWTHILFTYDGSSKAKGVAIYLDGQPVNLEIIADHLKSSMIYYGKDKENWGGVENLVIGKRSEETLNHTLVDEISVFNRSLTPIEALKISDHPVNLKQYLGSDKQKEKQLYAYYISNCDKEYEQNFEKLTEARGQENDVLSALPEVMVMEDLRKPRTTHLLRRGAYDAPGEVVHCNTPQSILAFSDKYPKNRLGLAEWLFDENNPLTARVMVNRLWQMIFGQGIVKTSEDFGNQGSLPTHPELLDWLAVEFRESGWDMQHMLKLMVMSATYRQSSVPTKEMLEKDPQNEFLARAPSYRLPAEMIRDNALAASGLLVEKIGGPPVKPYQPPGLWKELATRNVTVYVQDKGDDLYRRSLYTIWKRTSPPPSMINFDASERNACQVRRQKTNTPLQALVLLNDPQYVESSRLLAERMMTEGGNDLTQQIIYAFRLLTSRRPDQQELDILTQLFKETESDFESHPDNADKLVSTGDYPVDKNINPVLLAANTVVASTIMNFDETIIKR